MTLPGDLNGDGSVDLEDFSVFKDNMGLTLSPNPPTSPSHVWWNFPNAAFGPATTYQDVRQGLAADCYLMGPLAALAQTRPDALWNIIRDSYADAAGVHYWTVSLFWGGDWQAVTVDSLFPAYSTSHAPAYANIGNEGETFAQLVEKAMIVLRGGAYWPAASFPMGDAASTMKMLTGNDAVTVCPSLLTPAELEAKIAANLAAGVPMAAVTKAAPTTPLQGNHAYAVVGCASGVVTLWSNGEIAITVESFRDNIPAFYEAVV